MVFGIPSLGIKDEIQKIGVDIGNVGSKVINDPTVQKLADSGSKVAVNMGKTAEAVSGLPSSLISIMSSPILMPLLLVGGGLGIYMVMKK